MIVDFCFNSKFVTTHLPNKTPSKYNIKIIRENKQTNKTLKQKLYIQLSEVSNLKKERKKER